MKGARSIVYTPGTRPPPTMSYAMLTGELRAYAGRYVVWGVQHVPGEQAPCSRGPQTPACRRPSSLHSVPSRPRRYHRSPHATGSTNCISDGTRDLIPSEPAFEHPVEALVSGA